MGSDVVFGFGIALAIALGLGIVIGMMVATIRYQRRHEAGLREQIRRLTDAEEVWNTLTRTVISSQDLAQVFETTIHLVNEKMQVESSALLLRDQDTDELVFAEIIRRNKKAFDFQRIPIGQGIAGWVAKTGQPALVLNASTDPRFDPGWNRITGLDIQSVLCVPLKVKDEITGVIELLNKQQGEFTADDLRFLESIAAPVAIAIQNALLHQRIKHQMSELISLLQQVQHAKKEWEQIIDVIDEGIVLVDNECQILRVNRTLAAWLQTTPQALVGRRCDEAIHGAEMQAPCCTGIPSSAPADSVYETDLDMPRLGGWVHFAVYKLCQPDGTAIGNVLVLKKTLNPPAGSH